MCTTASLQVQHSILNPKINQALNSRWPSFDGGCRALAGNSAQSHHGPWYDPSARPLESLFGGVWTDLRKYSSEPAAYGAESNSIAFRHGCQVVHESCTCTANVKTSPCESFHGRRDVNRGSPSGFVPTGPVPTEHRAVSPISKWCVHDMRCPSYMYHPDVQIPGHRNPDSLDLPSK